MIISASRRTDIPAYYADWFFNRIQEGFAYARNPFNKSHVRRIALAAELVDGIVFWSKNPAPMLDRLGLIAAYSYYFQFTLNPYQSDLEPGLPERQRRIETFMKLAERIGPERVIWRYDPVILNRRCTIPYHIENFGAIAACLRGYTSRVIFSFVDHYRKIAGSLQRLGISEITLAEKTRLAGAFGPIAAENGLAAAVCAEDIDLSCYGIQPAACVDAPLIARISGRAIAAGKDRNQRPACCCAQSADIGEYDSCPCGCVYCYANSGARAERKHDSASPLLSGALPGGREIQDELFR